MPGNCQAGKGWSCENSLLKCRQLSDPKLRVPFQGSPFKQSYLSQEIPPEIYDFLAALGIWKILLLATVSFGGVSGKLSARSRKIFKFTSIETHSIEPNSVILAFCHSEAIFPNSLSITISSRESGKRRKISSAWLEAKMKGTIRRKHKQDKQDVH